MPQIGYFACGTSSRLVSLTTEATINLVHIGGLNNISEGLGRQYSQAMISISIEHICTLSMRKGAGLIVWNLTALLAVEIVTLMFFRLCMRGGIVNLH